MTFIVMTILGWVNILVGFVMVLTGNIDGGTASTAGGIALFAYAQSLKNRDAIAAMNGEQNERN